ncbi:DUF2752 domain-containing protein [Sediminibacterium ginsengisoli]|uniref:DUF2752 domain-containing protein n=1 Tax=Sediminibacterium ginsengisoli TaxID=413434 RepID=A0A1T4JV90_9BACT|nr:DUF2752 domain-containing protein [Sediminibacterium ginsengisoli]SJZ34054.1 Protein of unknown function [Sediminibacterium ginsengisoli]
MIRIGHFLLKYNELLFWFTALVLLFFLPVEKPATSLCLSSLVGLGKCPGCGIGHAIHEALHLRLRSSWQYHPLGIFAVIVIFIRLKQLLQSNTL